MHRFIYWTGFAALVGAFCLWRYGSSTQVPLPEDRHLPPSDQAVVVKPGTHFWPLFKSPPKIIPLPPASAPLSQGISPEKASFEAIVNATHNGTALFQLAENPRIYVIDYESLHVQGRALNRIAAFVEWQEAPKDQVLDDKALATLLERTSENPATLFFGHDYRATDLARFFTAVQRSGVVLNEEERALQALLLGQNFMRAGKDGFIPISPEKVLVSIPKEQDDDPQTPQNESVTWLMRRTILSHELSHGEFFTNPNYARYCEEFWHHQLSDAQRAGFMRFLSSAQHYDVRNETLLINEFQAYLVYSGMDGIFFRYDAVPGIDETEMLRLRERFLTHSPALFKPPQDNV